jgi:hypothetical protein
MADIARLRSEEMSDMIGNGAEIFRLGAELAEVREAAKVRSEYAPLGLMATGFRMQCRVDAILERDKDEETAVTGKGIGISYLLAKDIVQVMEDGHAEIDRLHGELNSARDAIDLAHLAAGVLGERLNAEIAGLKAELAAAVASERERCARIAIDGCLVPPDGGSPTEAEYEMCQHIAAAIRSAAP